MRFFIGLVCIFLISICVRPCFADIQMQTGLTFDWWGDSKDNSARQLQVPITITGTYQDFSCRLLTAYATTNLDRSGIGKNSLDHLLDTKLVTSYEIIGKLPVDILLGLDFNLPTGKTNLRQSDLALIMDPDLVSINNFGEGFDVNPTVTVAKEMGNWLVGASFGYLWRGSYDYSSDINITDYQPGEIYNLNAEARYYFTSQISARIFGSHAWYGSDTLRGTEYFQEGDFSRFGAGFNYAGENGWDAGISFHGILRDKNRFQTTTPGVIVTESFDHNGDEWVVNLAAGYRFPDAKTYLKSSIQGRYFTENDYPATSTFFIGKREKLTVGVGVTRALGDRFEAGLNVKGFVKHDDEANYPAVKSARDYQGVSVSLVLAGKF